MTCREVIDLVADYLANDLCPRAACPDCVTYVRGYADAIRLARAAYAEPDDRVAVTAAS